MTLTIEIAPDAEAQLREKARRRGQAAEEYVRALVERDLSAAHAQPSSEDTEARLKLWREFAQDIPDYRAEAGLPPLSDYAVSRAGIYEEEGGGRG